MTDDEIIAVVQARKDGKKIQSRSSEDYYGHKAKESDWSDCCSVTWDFYHVEYRVAPKPRKPREFVVNLYSDGSISSTWEQREIKIDRIRVREVID